MNPSKVSRDRLHSLTDLPNIGGATAEDLRALGVSEPAQLTEMCPFEMYDRLCSITGSRQDPCVLDVFISITRFMNGEDPKPWWHYTEERKRSLRDPDYVRRSGI